MAHKFFVQLRQNMAKFLAFSDWHGMNRFPPRWWTASMPMGVGRSQRRAFGRWAACAWRSTSGYDRDRRTASRTTYPSTARFLKNAALCGTKVINNPFWWSADDKFFNYALAAILGVPCHATVLSAAQTAPRPAPPIAPCATWNIPLDWGGHLPVRRLPRVFSSHTMAGAGRT